jgi:hypothetical protein
MLHVNASLAIFVQSFCSAKRMDLPTLLKTLCSVLRHRYYTAIIVGCKMSDPLSHEIIRTVLKMRPCVNYTLISDAIRALKIFGASSD